MKISARQAFYATVASAGLALGALATHNKEETISFLDDTGVLQLFENDLSAIAGRIYDAQKEKAASIDTTPDGAEVISDYNELMAPVLETIINDIENGETNAATIARHALASVQNMDENNSTPSADIQKQSLLIEAVLRNATASHVETQNTRELASLIISTMIDAGIQTRTPNAQFLTEMGLNTMMQSLDPHSSYMAVTPERLEAQQNRTGGTFSGIGVEVNLDYEIDDPDNAPENPTLKKGLNIASIIDEASPAAEAGVQDGDIITHVNDTPLAGLTISEAVELIKGPTGSDVDLTIQRGGEDQALNITVTRGPIPESPIVQAMLEGNIGYIRAKAFNAQTDRFMDEAIEELEARGAERFILDLRYNPGGLITEADHMIENFMDGDQALLDYWEQRNALAEEIRSVAGTVTAEDLPEPTAEQQAMIEENTSVNIRRRYGKAPEFYITPGVETDKPLVILMNEYSASASELVAGALQDFGRATIVGTQSFGKGSMHVSGAMDVDRDGVPDALINLTTGLYYVGPGGGRSIHGVGVTPDIRLSEEFKFVSEPRRTEAGLASSIHTPEDNNDHSISNSECRPANQEIALADMDPWLECAMAYLNGQTQTSNVTIAPLDPAAPN